MLPMTCGISGDGAASGRSATHAGIRRVPEAEIAFGRAKEDRLMMSATRGIEDTESLKTGAGMRTGGPDVMEVGMSCLAAGTRIANETGRGSLLAGEAMFEIARDMMRRGAVRTGKGEGFAR